MDVLAKAHIVFDSQRDTAKRPKLAQLQSAKHHRVVAVGRGERQVVRGAQIREAELVAAKRFADMAADADVKAGPRIDRRLRECWRCHKCKHRRECRGGKGSQIHFSAPETPARGSAVRTVPRTGPKHTRNCRYGSVTGVG